MRTEQKARFYTSKRGNTYFAITTDFLEGFKPTAEEMKKCKAKKLTDFFELYDDDDNKYYSGYANLDLMADFDLNEFDILDLATNHSGCTYMKTRGKDGKMEMV
jgi:hypothetical protein